MDRHLNSWKKIANKITREGYTQKIISDEVYEFQFKINMVWLVLFNWMFIY